MKNMYCKHVWLCAHVWLTFSRNAFISFSMFFPCAVFLCLPIEAISSASFSSSSHRAAFLSGPEVVLLMRFSSS